MYDNDQSMNIQLRDNPIQDRIIEIYNRLREVLDQNNETLAALRQLIDRSSGEYEAADFLDFVKGTQELLQQYTDELAQVQENIDYLLLGTNFIISTGQQNLILCQLSLSQKRQHPVTSPQVCDKDSRHVYCGKHNISKCIVNNCGGNVL